MVTSYKRGHKITYINDKWYYKDDMSLANYERPCAKCLKKSTKEGYDACLGYIKGAESACCGHGAEEPFIIMGMSEE